MGGRDIYDGVWIWPRSLPLPVAVAVAVAIAVAIAVCWSCLPDAGSHKQLEYN